MTLPVCTGEDRIYCQRANVPAPGLLASLSAATIVLACATHSGQTSYQALAGCYQVNYSPVPAIRPPAAQWLWLIVRDTTYYGMSGGVLDSSGVPLGWSSSTRWQVRDDSLHVIVDDSPFSALVMSLGSRDRDPVGRWEVRGDGIRIDSPGTGHLRLTRTRCPSDSLTVQPTYPSW